MPISVASQPATWVIGASWIAAAGLYSLLCVRGTRAPKYDFSRGLAYDPELLRASYVIRASQAPAGSEPYAEGAWLVRDVTAASARALLDEALKTDPAAFMAALA